jgi:hypothetical protein
MSPEDISCGRGKTILGKRTLAKEETCKVWGMFLKKDIDNLNKHEYIIHTKTIS